jgi:anti-sigma B factor antagonist
VEGVRDGKMAHSPEWAFCFPGGRLIIRANRCPTMLDETTIPSGTVLALAGEFDLAQTPRLRDAFQRVVGQSTVVLDMSRVTYMDSTTLGALTQLRTRLADDGGALILVGVSGVSKRLFDITGLVKIFDLRPSLAEVEHVGDLRRIEIVADA